MANLKKQLLDEVNNGLNHDIYENLPCHTAANNKLLTEKVEMLSLEAIASAPAPNHILLSNEMLYATPLRKSERSNRNKTTTTPTKSSNSGIIKKVNAENPNGRSASTSNKKSTEPGSSQPYFENNSATAGQYYEESRIRDFLKDTSQMHRKMELHKDLNQCSNFSHLARKEHFAHLVQQNVTASIDSATATPFQCNGATSSPLTTSQQDDKTNLDEKFCENLLLGSLNSSLVSDKESTELNNTSKTLAEAMPPTAPSMADMDMDDSNQKCALNREWVLKKIALCLEQRSFLKKPVPSLPAAEIVKNGLEIGEGPFFQRAVINSAHQATSVGLPQLGYLVLGANGSGKTSICYDIIEGMSGTRGMLNRRLLAFYLINSQNPECHNLSHFVRSLVLHILSHSSYVIKEDAINPVANSNYEQKKEVENEIEAAQPNNESLQPIETAESASSFQDKELEEIILSEMKLNQRVAEFCARKVTTNSPLVRQQSEPTQSMNVKEVHSFPTYTTHPPLAKNQHKDISDTNSKLTVADSNTQSEKTSPTKKLSKIPMPIGKNLLKHTVGDENREQLAKNDETIVADIEKSELSTTVEQELTAEIATVQSESVDKIVETDVSLIDLDETVELKSLTPEKASNVQPVVDQSTSEFLPQPLPPKSKNCRTKIADNYYEMLVSNPEIMDALTIENIEKNPDDSFKKAILFPLLELNPPKNALLLLIDSIDENHLNENNLISTLKGRSHNTTTAAFAKSRNIAELLSNHVHLFPKWLFLVCTAKKQNKSITKLFTGFKKLTLDDLRKSHVVKDVQQYIINRLNYDFRGINLTKEIIESLNQLYIKSNGCLLYLHKVLSCIKTNFFTFREIKLIPCTLNGLYLYICQKSFNKKQYAKIRPILNILLVSSNYVDKVFVFQCMRTHNYTLNMEEFEKRLDLMTNILQYNADDMIQFKIFHNSFCDWLLDVKFSTKKFVCDINEGHVMVAMYYTLISETLCPNQVRSYLYHLIRSAEYLKTGSGNVTVDLLLILLESQTNLSDCFYTNLINCCKQCELNCKNDPNLSSFKTKVMLEKFLNHQLGQEFMHFMIEFFKPCLPTDPKTLKLLIETGLNTENQSFDSSRFISPTIITPSDEEDRSQNIDSELAELLISSEKSCQHELLRKDDEKEDGAVQQAVVASSSKCKTVAESVDDKQQNKMQCDIFDLSFHKGKALIHILANEGNHVLLERALVACKDQLIDLEIEDLNGQTALNIAARNGHVEIVQLLLNFKQNSAAATVNVNHADRDGWSPLRSASWGGHTEIVKLLISHSGCDIDRADKEGRTALRAAAWSGNEDIVNILIAAGANVNSIDLQGRTSLIAASYMGHYEIVEILLENGADVNHTDLDGRNALCVAALCGSSGYSKVISSLLEHGANTDQTDNEGMSPLLVSSFEGNAEICELLLENSADPDLADHMCRTPLFAACTSGHANVVKLLLFWGCGIDCMDVEGRTVLSVAAAQGNLETVRQLLDRGLDETHRDNAGWTPLHYSAYEGNSDICIQLLDSGAKIDESDNEGKAPLHLASQEGHNAVIEALLNVHVQCIDQKAHDGKTAFRLACLEGHFECIQTLLKYGCDVNAKDADARTTLYILALENKLKVVKYLLEFSNVNVNIPDSEGRTALHVAAWQGHTEMVKLLITIGNADVNAMDLEQRTPLHSCAWQGNAKVMEMLLYYNAVADHACKQGATSLGISAQEGHEKCVKILLQYGANPFKSDHCGRTPIKLAAKSNRNNVLKILETFVKNENLLEVNKYHPNLQLQSPDKFQEKIILPGNSPNNGLATNNINHANNSLMPNTVSATNSSHNSNFYENTMQSNTSSLQKRKSVISSQSTGSSNDQVPTFTQQLQKHSRHHNTKSILVIPPTRQSSASNSKYGNKKISTNLPDVDEYQTNIATNLQNKSENDIFDLGCMSPLYASPPHSPSSENSSPGQQAPTNLDLEYVGSKLHQNVNIFNTDQHFARDTHMRIILGNSSREVKEQPSASKSSKRSGGTQNPAMRLIRNRIDSAAQLIRRTNNILTSNSSSQGGSSSIGVKSSTFQWRKE